MTEETNQPPNSEPDPLTIGSRISLLEASEASGFSKRYLKTIAYNGRLRAEKIGHQWQTTMAAIEAYKASRSHINDSSKKPKEENS